MLVIRRRAGQSIRIGDEIEVHVAELSPTKVTIAIRAPRNVAVSRAELTLTREQNLLAADSVTADALARLTGDLPARVAACGTRGQSDSRSGRLLRYGV